MRTGLFRGVLAAGFLAGVLCQAQQYPPPPPQQPQYPPAQQPQYPPAQQPAYGQPPQLQSPQQLDQVVGPIALYPDGLLAQVLTAATYSDQLPDAAGWANQHAYMRPEGLPGAIQADNLQFAPSVMALLPFPQVLSYMAQNMVWTEQLGNAVLAQRPEVMDAVQRMREQAYNYGYLQDPQFSRYERVQVIGPHIIEIVPVNPGYYYVPYYSPYAVFARPRSRAFVTGAFSFGGGIQIGAAFAPWGWGGTGFGWREHNILIDNRPWVRSWSNRAQYAHPYREPYRALGPRHEGHEYRDYRGRAEHDGHDHRDERHDDHHDR